MAVTHENIIDYLAALDDADAAKLFSKSREKRAMVTRMPSAPPGQLAVMGESGLFAMMGALPPDMPPSLPGPMPPQLRGHSVPGLAMQQVARPTVAAAPPAALPAQPASHWVPVSPKMSTHDVPPAAVAMQAGPPAAATLPPQQAWGSVQAPPRSARVGGHAGSAGRESSVPRIGGSAMRESSAPPRMGQQLPIQVPQMTAESAKGEVSVPSSMAIGKKGSLVEKKANYELGKLNKDPKPIPAGETHMLICALDYIGSASPLTCSIDGKNMQALAKLSGIRDVEAMYNTECKKEAIIAALKRTAQKCQPGDTFFFFFAGHGMSSTDYDGDEEDGKDENYVCDFTNQRMDPAKHYLSDDELASILTMYIHFKVNIIVVSDCCHSGSVCDFGKRIWAGFNAVSISGCRDCQTSGDTGKGGICTHSMMLAIEQLLKEGNTDWSVAQLYRKTVFFDDTMMASSQDIQFDKAPDTQPNLMPWPLVPLGPFVAPYNSASGLLEGAGVSNDAVMGQQTLAPAPAPALAKSAAPAFVQAGPNIVQAGASVQAGGAAQKVVMMPSVGAAMMPSGGVAMNPNGIVTMMPNGGNAAMMTNGGNAAMMNIGGNAAMLRPATQVPATVTPSTAKQFGGWL